MQVFATLQQHALSDSQHALIVPAHMLGQSETKRQQLRRALHHQRAGIALPEGSQLERERHVEAAELDPLSTTQVCKTPHTSNLNCCQRKQLEVVHSALPDFHFKCLHVS